MGSMISIGKMASVDQVVRYLAEAATDAAVEYYTTEREAPGRWIGRAAERLGLGGEVAAEHLRTLLNGRDPHRDVNLVERHWSVRSVAAFDVTFSAPLLRA